MGEHLAYQRESFTITSKNYQRQSRPPKSAPRPLTLPPHSHARYHPGGIAGFRPVLPLQRLSHHHQHGCCHGNINQLSPLNHRQPTADIALFSAATTLHRRNLMFDTTVTSAYLEGQKLMNRASKSLGTTQVGGWRTVTFVQRSGRALRMSLTSGPGCVEAALSLNKGGSATCSGRSCS